MEERTRRSIQSSDEAAAEIETSDDRGESVETPSHCARTKPYRRKGSRPTRSRTYKKEMWRLWCEEDKVVGEKAASKRTQRFHENDPSSKKQSAVPIPETASGRLKNVPSLVSRKTGRTLGDISCHLNLLCGIKEREKCICLGKIPGKNGAYLEATAMNVLKSVCNLFIFRESRRSPITILVEEPDIWLYFCYCFHRGIKILFSNTIKQK